MRNDREIELWMDNLMDYLQDEGFSVQISNSGDKEEYFLEHPERYGSKKIWIRERSIGLVLEVFTDPDLFVDFEHINVCNIFLNYSKVITNKSRTMASYRMFIPYAPQINNWLGIMIDDFVNEIQGLQDKIQG